MNIKGILPGHFVTCGMDDRLRGLMKSPTGPPAVLLRRLSQKPAGCGRPRSSEIDRPRDGQKHLQHPRVISHDDWPHTLGNGGG